MRGRGKKVEETEEMEEEEEEEGGEGRQVVSFGGDAVVPSRAEL